MQVGPRSLPHLLNSCNRGGKHGFVSRDDAYVGFYMDSTIRDELDQLARENLNSRSAELRRAVVRHLHAERPRLVESRPFANRSAATLIATD